MSTFVPQKRHLREALLFLFYLKKKVSEAHQMLVEAYGNDAPSERTCREWFQRFKSNDFDVNNKDREGFPKKFEDEEFQVLLDKDSTQTQKQLAASLNITRQAVSHHLHAMGKIQKEGKWVPYELTERNKEQRKTTCEILFERFQRKSFLHRIVTGDEKWLYFVNPKRKRSGRADNIDRKVEYLRKKGLTLHLVGSARYIVLRASPTRRNDHCQSLRTTACPVTQQTRRKETRMGESTQQSDTPP